MVFPPGIFSSVEDIMKVFVDIETHDDFVGDSRDHAVVDIDDRLRERVKAFKKALAELGATYISEFDYSLEFNFVNPVTRVEIVQLYVAADGDFWWQGVLKNTSVHWQTGRIPFALLEEPEDAEHDLREHKEDEEDEEPGRFINRYRHCGQEWEDRWSCACNDKCPVCGGEIEPYGSEEIDAAGGEG
jgi:hypothetical protein